MCAMMPMLRYRSSGYSRFTVAPFCGFCSIAIISSRLPLVVRERLVGLSHLVRLFLAADRAAGVVHRVDELTREPVGHRLTWALARGLDDPAHRERTAAIRADLDRHLV